MASCRYLLNSCIQNLTYHVLVFRAKHPSKTRRYSVTTCKSSCRRTSDEEKCITRKLKILIAGGDGLVLALAAKRRGFEVQAFEKDLSAVRGEGQHRSPIQLVSSALAVLEAIDENVAKQIMGAGCVTGNRTTGYADTIQANGLQSLISSPALTKGLPLTIVICRMALQDILVNAVGTEIVRNKSKVVDFIQDPGKVRLKLFGRQEAKYSSYASYSGVTNFVPPYIDSVA